MLYCGTAVNHFHGRCMCVSSVKRRQAKIHVTFYIAGYRISPQPFRVFREALQCNDFQTGPVGVHLVRTRKPCGRLVQLVMNFPGYGQVGDDAMNHTMRLLRLLYFPLLFMHPLLLLLVLLLSLLLPSVFLSTT